LSFSTLEEKKSGEDNEPPGSSLFSALVEINVENDNEPGGLLSFSATEAKQPRTMINRDPDSLSSFALEEKTKR